MKGIEKAVSFVAAVLMFILMILTVIDVIGRNLFSHPLRGATELTEISLVALSFLLFPVLAIKGRHIVADVADVFNSRFLDWLQHVLTALLGVVFFGLVAWRIWILAGQAASYGDTTVSLRIPMAPILYGVSVLAGVAAFAFLLTLRTARQKVEEPHHSPADSIL